MKTTLILLATLSTSVSFAKTQEHITDRKPDSVHNKCVLSLEHTARTVSIATGMSRTEAIGTANPSEVNENTVVVYIGAHATFDRYEFHVANFQTCSLKDFSMTKAEE